VRRVRSGVHKGERAATKSWRLNAESIDTVLRNLWSKQKNTLESTFSVAIHTACADVDRVQV